MSAELLRQAATILRERAEAATPSERWVRNHFVPDSGSLHIERSKYIFSAVGGNAADRDYIATMHPGVGLSLADWLDAEATYAIECMTLSCDCPTTRATAVARLIVGDA
jgi:hypothetical protein